MGAEESNFVFEVISSGLGMSSKISFRVYKYNI